MLNLDILWMIIGWMIIGGYSDSLLCAKLLGDLNATSTSL